MTPVAIVTDSTAGYASDYVTENHIQAIPLYVQMGDDMLRDGVDITSEQFYERLPQCATLPTTSQPSVGDFVTLYKEAIDAGADGILSVHISSGISGTVNSATLASKELDGVPVEIVDTQCACAVAAFAVEAAQKALAEGADLAGAAAAAKQVVASHKTVFMVDTLEYLYKGGRIGGASALFGSLLQFKPLLHFVDGEIAALERQRTAKRAMARMVEVMAEWQGAETPLRAVVMQAAAPEAAQSLADMVTQKLNILDLRIMPLSPVIGTHAGPGTLGLCCCP